MNKENENKQYFEWLNVVRVIAILFVFLCHYSVSYVQYDISGFHNYLLSFANFDSGKVGVYLFFIISGYGLSYKYSYTKFSIIDFYKKRWIKIFPLFYICYIFST